MWALAELNTIAFIIIIKEDRERENIIKYFVIQSIGSAPLILAVARIRIGEAPAFFVLLRNNFIILAIAIKIGTAPFHFWTIQIGSTIKWNSLLILLTIQKAAPLYIISLSQKSKITLRIIVISSAISTVAIITCNKMKTIIILSSVNHLRWIIFTGTINKIFIIIYLTIYSIILLQLANEIKNRKMENIASEENQRKKSLLTLVILSLAGIPPFIGFFPKIGTVALSPKVNQLISLIIFILLITILRTLVYTRIIIKSLAKSVRKSSRERNKQPSKNLLISNTILIPFLIWYFTVL